MMDLHEREIAMLEAKETSKNPEVAQEDEKELAKIVSS